MSENMGDELCTHLSAIMQTTGDGTPVLFCPACGRNIWIGRAPQVEDAAPANMKAER